MHHAGRRATRALLILRPISSSRARAATPHSDIVGTLQLSVPTATTQLAEMFKQSSVAEHVIVSPALVTGAFKAWPSLRTQDTSHVPQVSVHVGGLNTNGSSMHPLTIEGQFGNVGGLVSKSSMC